LLRPVGHTCRYLKYLLGRKLQVFLDLQPHFAPAFEHKRPVQVDRRASLCDCNARFRSPAKVGQVVQDNSPGRILEDEPKRADHFLVGHKASLTSVAQPRKIETKRM
jgi:hypothetical protein